MVKVNYDAQSSLEEEDTDLSILFPSFLGGDPARGLQGLTQWRHEPYQRNPEKSISPRYGAAMAKINEWQELAKYGTVGVKGSASFSAAGSPRRTVRKS